MRIGVVVPVRTPSPYLGEALDGIVGQDPPPAQVVVVDDASPAPLELDPRHAGACRVLRLDSAHGPAGARQAGLAALSVDVVAISDDDDVWEPGKLAAQVAAMERNPAAAVCFGRATIVGSDGSPTGERWPEPEPGLHDPAEFGRSLYAHNPIPYSSAVVRRRALDSVGGFTTALEHGEDWDLWLRLAAVGHPFLCEPGARIRYRRHGGGMTADLTALARGSIAIHELHAGLVDPPARRRAQAADLTALARGRVRERDYGGARRALAQAAGLQPPGLRERLLRGLLAVPGVRELLGRRSPYPR